MQQSGDAPHRHASPHQWCRQCRRLVPLAGFDINWTWSHGSWCPLLLWQHNRLTSISHGCQAGATSGGQGWDELCRGQVFPSVVGRGSTCSRGPAPAAPGAVEARAARERVSGGAVAGAERAVPRRADARRAVSGVAGAPASPPTCRTTRCRCAQSLPENRSDGRRTGGMLKLQPQPPAHLDDNDANRSWL